LSAARSKSPLLKVAHFLANPEVFFYTAIWLIVLLVFGTVDQKYIGLHLSQEKYFSSWFVWGIFPGGRLTMTVMFLNLVCKLIFNSPIRWSRAGTLVTHSGMLLLLLGGFFTAYFSNEGSMPIPEGQTSSYYMDYHELEFAVIDKSPEDHDAVVAFSQNYIKEGSVISDPDFPFTISVKTFYRNRVLVQRDTPLTDGYHGLAQRFDIKTQKLENEFERNRAAVVLDIRGLDDEKDGTYALDQFMLVPQTLKAGGKDYVIELRNKRYQLPFALEVIDFKRKLHPGTQMASHYSSLVNVVDGEYKREVLISMNEPLRNLDYTFYQASFGIDDTGETTVLAVVQNAGRNFPYIASVIMCIGLLFHLILQVPKMVVRSKRA